MLASASRIAFRHLDRVAFSEGNFWAVIGSLGWGRSYDYESMKEDLMGRLDATQARDLQDMFRKKQGLLMKTLESYVLDLDDDIELGVSDDGFSDLTAHIIGLGKREYDAVMRNPQLGIDRAHARYGSPDGYKESFAYALPYDEDYKKVKPQQDVEHEEIDRPITSEDMPAGLAKAYKASVHAFLKALEREEAAEAAKNSAYTDAYKMRNNVEEWGTKTYGREVSRDWLGSALLFGEHMGPHMTRGKSPSEVREMWKAHAERVLKQL